MTAAPSAFDIASAESYCRQFFGDDALNLSGDPASWANALESVSTRASKVAVTGGDSAVSRLLAAAGAGPAVETTNPADVYEYIIAGWVNMLVALALLFVVRRALTRLFARLGIWGAAGLGDGLRRAERERVLRKHKALSFVDMHELKQWAVYKSHHHDTSGHGHGAAVSFSHGGHDSGAGFDMFKRLAQQASGVLGSGGGHQDGGSNSGGVHAGGAGGRNSGSGRRSARIAPSGSAAALPPATSAPVNAIASTRRLGITAVGLEVKEMEDVAKLGASVSFGELEVSPDLAEAVAQGLMDLTADEAGAETAERDGEVRPLSLARVNERVGEGSFSIFD
jgi:hypothetical protein